MLELRNNPIPKCWIDAVQYKHILKRPVYAIICFKKDGKPYKTPWMVDADITTNGEFETAEQVLQRVRSNNPDKKYELK